MTEEKIPVPAAWTVTKATEDERRELIGEWRQYLSAKQQENLDENPHGGFNSHIPIETLKNLAADEREELMAAEEAEYNRIKPVAQAKQDQLRAFVRAGGSAEAFEKRWNNGGREDHIARVANDVERAARASSPY